MMRYFDVLGKIAWVRLDFLSQDNISDIIILCARKIFYLKIKTHISLSGMQEKILLYNATFHFFLYV